MQAAHVERTVELTCADSPYHFVEVVERGRQPVTRAAFPASTGITAPLM